MVVSPHEFTGGAHPFKHAPSIMRTKPRLDRNHKEIVEGLRNCGCSVQSLAAIGGGCPDILVARNGRMWLFELKDGKKIPSKRKLTEQQVEWKVRWHAAVHTVESLERALWLVTNY